MLKIDLRLPYSKMTESHNGFVSELPREKNLILYEYIEEGVLIKPIGQIENLNNEKF